MRWSDVTRPPTTRMLRQFAALWLVVFSGMAMARWYGGRGGAGTILLAAVAVVVGVTGLAAPRIVRPIYMGWMIAAFPIGWVVSRVMLAVVFFGVLLPISLVFRLRGRDLLWLRRPVRESYWTAKRQTNGPETYLRQF